MTVHVEWLRSTAQHYFGHSLKREGEGGGGFFPTVYYESSHFKGLQNNSGGKKKHLWPIFKLKGS